MTDYAAPHPAPAKAPGLVVVQEWWGLNDHIKDLCNRFAAQGFLVIGVDLYGGRVTKDAGEAMQLMMDLKTRDALEIIGAAVDRLRADPGCNGKVGVVGFCLGGAMSLASACNLAIDAAVPFYGLPRAEYADWTKVRCPIEGHYAERDPHVTKERVSLVRDALVAAGKSVEFHFYDAEHAFANDTRGEVYDRASAELALSRTTAFLHAHLG
ncbi:MAG: dienelactone hydrolase family protein [Myxococcales bacterium]|nr:dienelactone hydrolase family protein [Myxococcales bacterium]